MKNLKRNTNDKNKYYLNGWDNCILKKSSTKFWEVWKYTPPVIQKNNVVLEDSKYQLIASSMVLQGLDCKLSKIKEA